MNLQDHLESTDVVGLKISIIVAPVRTFVNGKKLMTEFTFSKHALEQMLIRHISMEEALGTLQYADNVIKLEDEQYIYQKTFESVDKPKYLIRILVNGNKKKKTPRTYKNAIPYFKIYKYY
ncbi:MAG: hypothetical protein IPN89_02405 [Saprospiraceae bacterium]|nr:hypothetical protein [Saprospiraceae bacterium]